MLIAALVCAGSGLLWWPSRRGRVRLDRVFGASRYPSLAQLSRNRGCRGALVAVGIVLAAWVLGPAGAGAFGLLAVAGWRQLRSRARVLATITSAERLAEALRTMVGELRAGAHPARAAETTAAQSPPETAHVFATVAAFARLGGRLDLDIPATERRSAVAAAAFRQFTRAWELAQRHGLPLAEVLAAVQRDVEASARFAKQTRARMAGPRASAAVLAGLPLVGVALGEAMGARPVHVLTTSAPGQLLLLAGCGLVLAGVAWSARLTDQTVSL